MSNPLLKKEEKDARQRLRDIESAKVIGAINRTFATEDGMLTLQWLMNLCEWDLDTVCQDPKSLEINPLLTTMIAIRQGVYRQIRRHVKADVLKQVEFKAEQQNEGETK